MTDHIVPGINNFKVIGTGMFRGGQPDGAGWQWLQQAGVKRVIKLNEDSDGSDDPAVALGMEVIKKPIGLYEQLVFRPKYQDVLAATEAMGPNTFVHCKNGWDRTGLVVGCYRVWDESWKKEDAYAEMIQHGFHPELLGLTLFWEWAV